LLVILYDTSSEIYGAEVAPFDASLLLIEKIKRRRKVKVDGGERKERKKRRRRRRRQK
jgi:hypothetical protein